MEKLNKVIKDMTCCVSGKCAECSYGEVELDGCCEELIAVALSVIRSLEKKYATAVEMAATATELAAKYRRTDGDLISRSDVLKYPLRRDTCDKKNANPHFISGVESVMEYVEALPSAEAEPVVHAHWEDMYGGKYANPRYRCSACKEKALYKLEQDVLLSWHEVQALTPICHNCGAHMDEEVAL
jgi:hypothetical protein